MSLCKRRHSGIIIVYDCYNIFFHKVVWCCTHKCKRSLLFIAYLYLLYEVRDFLHEARAHNHTVYSDDVEVGRNNVETIQVWQWRFLISRGVRYSRAIAIIAYSKPLITFKLNSTWKTTWKNYSINVLE